MQIRSKYSYQMEMRTQITTNIRKDLRVKLKDFSVNVVHNPETKIYDCMLDYFLNDKQNQKLLIDLVKNYY